VLEASRLREQVEKHPTACTQVLFRSKAEMGFFHFLEIVTGWLVPSSTAENPAFLQVRELKIQRKKSRQCFRDPKLLEYASDHTCWEHNT